MVWGRSAIRGVLTGLLVLVLASAASAQTRRVTLAWDANTDPWTAGYAVFVALATGQQVASVNVGSQTSVALDLPIGSSYIVGVRAYTVAGMMGPASEIAVDLAAVPAAPLDFRAAVNGSAVTLEWNPPGGGGLPLGYFLSVGTSPGASNLGQDLPLGDVRQISANLAPGAYYARLRAANLVGLGPPTPDVAFQVAAGRQPLTPSGLTVSWSGTVATLSWQAPVSDDPLDLPTTYVIEAGSRSGLSDQARLNVGPARSYAVDVPPGTYYVRVRGLNAFGASNPSNEIVVSGRGAPTRPGRLYASGSGSTVTLRWSPPTGDAPVTAYVVDVGSAPGLSNLATVNVGAATTFTASAPPGTYYVRVRAVNARGSSPPSNEVIVSR